jgi:DNA-binding protein YbaB
MTIVSELKEKDADTREIALNALKDVSIFSELLETLKSREDTVRFNSFQSVLYLSEKYPEKIYPYWDFFANLLTSRNTYHKYIGIYLIAALTQHEKGQKFESLFDTYFGLLDDKSVIPPSHIAKNVGKIVRVHPHLEEEITHRLLSIDETHHDPERKALIKGYIIEAFNDYFEISKDKQKIMEFVREQIESESPKTRKIAKEFLRRWNHE